MSIRVLVDMNLSVQWVAALAEHGWHAVHWSQVGQPTAPDAAVLAWASAHGYVVFTHDLDYGTDNVGSDARGWPQCFSSA